MTVDEFDLDVRIGTGFGIAEPVQEAADVQLFSSLTPCFSDHVPHTCLCGG